MPESDKVQKCIIINKTNISIIENSLDTIVSQFTKETDYTTIHDILETRKRIKDIREIIDQVEEVKVCWG